MTLDKQISCKFCGKSKVTRIKVPSPTGITAPVRENPNTVVDDVLTVNPFSSAAPPETSKIFAQSISNWNPAIAVESVEYNIAMVLSSISSSLFIEICIDPLKV